ncbi:MAG: deoxyribose-phosphate aldolase [Synergistaceae bacterium]
MNMSSLIDHTLLKPDALGSDIQKLCEEAAEWKFASVCVNSCHAADAVRMLSGTGIAVCVVVGFPLGACASEVKAFEAGYAEKCGASEVDMVLNISWLKDGLYNKVYDDIFSVVSAAPKCAVKVIIETCLLTNDEIIKACEIAKSAGAHFVKTSTGFSKGGAKAEDVALMRSVVGIDFGVKASGGIRDFKTAEEMVKAGANRLGTSQSVSLCKSAVCDLG